MTEGDRQKDKDARWIKKHGKSYFGYKNHVNVDRRHKLIRRYAATDAVEHDSAPSESSGRASRSACCISLTCEGWSRSNGWPPLDGRSLTSATATSRRAEVAGSGPTGKAGFVA